MAARTHGERLDRLEKAVAQLATETRRGFDRVAKQFEETGKLIHAVDRRSVERNRETDARIEKLVIAIGEFIRRQNGHKR